jgi:hypothetical protein
MKSYTNIEQSKKLASILSLDSADMWWSRCTITDFGDGVLKVSYAVEPCNISQFRNTKEDIPCWSLAALLSVLPNENMLVKTIDGEYYCLAKDVMTKHYDNPVDACVAIIEKLHELNLLIKEK